MPEKNPRSRRAYFAFKRALDLVGSLVGLSLLFLIFPFISIAIWFDTPGPIFFVQTRVGQYGRRFKFIKFRTMTTGAYQRQGELDSFNETGGLTFKIKGDPRVTPVGKWLRRSSIDEMPQFWNVLSGDMSLVGPRPPLLGEVERYDQLQKIRMTVPQGLTGLWQVRGRSGLDFSGMVDLDVHYALHSNFGIDLAILWHTIPAVLLGRGAR
jgi:lipopolysaccharide/colanic/teichoic acid biosynthesis glycosyltransferase